jgi:type 1 glutamine amidotransferase
MLPLDATMNTISSSGVPHGPCIMKTLIACSCLCVFLLLSGIPHAQSRERTNDSETGFSVLVFSKTAGFRHDSIPDGIAAIEQLGADNNFSVVATEDDAQFTDDNLANYAVVVFLNTTGTVLDDAGKAAFMRYIEGGGGFVGIHSATDTEYEWPWYGQLVGAYFQNHPAIQQATVDVVDQQHPSTVDLPLLWVRTDEWYNFQTNPRGSVHVLAVLDETTYSGGTMGDHPISWCQEFDNGRSWYTAMGHTQQTYSEPLYQRHLLGGILYAAGVAAGECVP